MSHCLATLHSASPGPKTTTTRYVLFMTRRRRHFTKRRWRCRLCLTTTSLRASRVMATGMDLALLRQLVGSVVVPELKSYAHPQLGDACVRLGLPEPPPESEGTKHQ